ncbi:MAG: Wzt carbohydrate-binding domain-containing protein [Acidobacteriota bacterium]
MAIEFRQVSHVPLLALNAVAPDGAVIGIIGEDGAGKRALLRLAAGLESPGAGEVRTGSSRRYLGPADPLNLSPVDTLVLENTLAQHDALVRARAAVGLERLRRAGTTVLMLSHEEELQRALCDEIWWLHEGKLAARGDPAETLDRYRRHIAGRLRAWGESAASPLAPSLRRGDGRARIVALETVGETGKPTMVWESGEPVSVRVTVLFEAPVADPVVGIMIRTRIGFEVYGTNTELEGVKLGPCQPRENVRVTFSFRCDLCPQEYTITAASHDPDGVWHDWLEDAVAFSVTDSRYTAGVANLRALVSVG